MQAVGIRLATERTRRAGGREVLARECALVDVDAERVEGFIGERRLDPAFAPFVAAARAAGRQPSVVRSKAKVGRGVIWART